MNIMFWDLSLLVLFILLSGFFLYKKRNKVKREGSLWLYHTKWGLKLIEKTGKKHKRLINLLSYVSVFIGYLLMILIVYMFIKIVLVYVFHPGNLSSKVPPIMPLIPYLPQIFKINSLPPFYFSYWIIILAIIAVTHEFFHGIFASAKGIKTKTTGFGFFPFFLPAMPLAFVNLDEKKMEKSKNFSQRSVLSAGTFANILTTILALLLMWGFFSLTYSPAGVVYNDYAYNSVNLNSIYVNGIPISKINSTLNLPHNSIVSGNTTYYALKQIQGNNALLYYNSPAIKSNLSGAIMAINNKKVTSLSSLSSILSKYKPNQVINITSFNGNSYKTIPLTLKASPLNNSQAWIGIVFANTKSMNSFQKFLFFFSSYKNPNVYYKPSSGAATFGYEFLWWLMIISLSVALINMVPVGIFDGGRFFYLTVLKITKSKKIAEKSFKYITQFFLFLLIVMTVFWAITLF